MKHRLLILGSLREFVQLIELAKSRGIHTIVCDGYHDSPGKLHGDTSYDIPPGEIDRIAELCQKEQVDGIITSFSDYLFECMVKIAAKANLKCYFSPEKLDLYRNKSVMKAMLDTLGIPNAKSAVISRDFQSHELMELHFPIVTKPLDRYGSRGVFVLHSPEEIRQNFDIICEISSVKQILIEEYNDGYEFNMMSWLVNGKVHVLGIADREKTPISGKEIPISSRNVYPSRLISHVYEDAREILQKVADYTGQTQGPLSMQFFWKPGGPVSVGEVAGRFLGYEHELLEYCSGLSLEELLLDYVYDDSILSKKLEHYSPFFNRHSAVLYYHGKEGMVIANQENTHKLEDFPQIQDAQVFYREGEAIVSHGPNPYVLRYFLSADSRNEIDQITEQLFQQITVTDSQGDSVIYRNQMTTYPDDI